MSFIIAIVVALVFLGVVFLVLGMSGSNTTANDVALGILCLIGAAVLLLLRSKIDELLRLPIG